MLVFFGLHFLIVSRVSNTLLKKKLFRLTYKPTKRKKNNLRKMMYQFLASVLSLTVFVHSLRINSNTIQVNTK